MLDLTPFEIRSIGFIEPVEAGGSLGHRSSAIALMAETSLRCSLSLKEVPPIRTVAEPFCQSFLFGLYLEVRL